LSFPLTGSTLSSPAGRGMKPVVRGTNNWFLSALKGPPLQGGSREELVGGVFPWVSPRATHSIRLQGILELWRCLLKVALD
jgi:hypothetical protein